MTTDPNVEAAYWTDARLRPGMYGGAWSRRDVYEWGWRARDAEVVVLQTQLDTARRNYEGALTAIGELIVAQGRQNVARSDSPARVMYECIEIAEAMAAVVKAGRLAVGGNMGGHFALRSALANLDARWPSLNAST